MVEQSLNTRPLTRINSDPDCLEAITPYQFLLGQPLPLLSFQEDFNHRKRFVSAQAYANACWTRWLGEYVPGLNKRAKWYSSPEQELKTGDLVWIVLSANPRGDYPVARHRTFNFGKDGVARSAVLKTFNGDITRTAAKFAPVLASLGAEIVATQKKTLISENIKPSQLN